MKKKRLATIAVAAASLTMGCAEPECSTTRIGELSSHWQSALQQIVDLDARGAAENLAIGVGITPHPAMALPGAMPVVFMPPTTGE